MFRARNLSSWQEVFSQLQVGVEVEERGYDVGLMQGRFATESN